MRFLDGDLVIRLMERIASSSTRRINKMLASISIALLALTAAQTATLPQRDAADDAAIRAIVADQVVAWNAGDGRRYASHLASAQP